MQIALPQYMPHEEPAAQFLDFPVGAAPASLLLQVEDPPVARRIPLADDLGQGVAARLLGDRFPGGGGWAPGAWLLCLRRSGRGEGACRDERRQDKPRSPAAAALAVRHAVASASASLFLMAIRSVHASFFWPGWRSK